MTVFVNNIATEVCHLHEVLGWDFSVVTFADGNEEAERAAFDAHVAAGNWGVLSAELGELSLSDDPIFGGEAEQE